MLCHQVQDEVEGCRVQGGQGVGAGRAVMVAAAAAGRQKYWQEGKLHQDPRVGNPDQADTCDKE